MTYRGANCEKGAEFFVIDDPTPHAPGRHLVQVPGPTNVPRTVLKALSEPTIDHRSEEFAELTHGLLRDIQPVFGSEGPVVMFAGSGTGAQEAALQNTLSPGDKVLSVETGHFARLWASMAERFGLEVERISTDWRHPVDPAAVADHLHGDDGAAIKAVLVTHNETSTGVLSDVAAVRQAIDAVGHPALLFVDAVSSLGSTEYLHDAWRVDVTVACSQKGLMLPPGLCFNAISDRALRASDTATLPRSYWSWAPVLEANASGLFPYTPPTNLLFGLRAALDLLETEGLAAVFARHRRHAAASRAAVAAWGLEMQCLDPSAYSPTLTAVVVPDGILEQDLRRVIHDTYAMSLGSGLGKLTGRVFRIGHLGDLGDLDLIAVLGGVELGLEKAKVPHHPGGVSAALEVLAAS